MRSSAGLSGASDATVRNLMAPVCACLGTAVRKGLIRSNPARDIDLPHRSGANGSEPDDRRALTREQLATFLQVVHPRHRVFFQLLAATGLRVSEVIALQWQHLELDGSSPHVKVRRGIVRGKVGALKTRHSRCDVPIAHELVRALRQHHTDSEWPGESDPVFPTTTGSILAPNNLSRRVLKPAAEEAGAPWAGFHTFRHTCASLLFAGGRNAVQVQRWLGHHSAAFTLATYVHLLDGDIGQPLDLGLVLGAAKREQIRRHAKVLAAAGWRCCLAQSDTPGASRHEKVPSARRVRLGRLASRSHGSVRSDGGGAARATLIRWL